MSQTEYGRSVYEVVTGQFRPDLISESDSKILQEALSNPGAAITPEQYDLAEMIAHRFRAHFGGAERGIPEFDRRSLLPTKSDEKKHSGFMLTSSGYIFMNTNHLTTINRFGVVFGHEYLHSISHRTMKNDKIRHVGINEDLRPVPNADQYQDLFANVKKMTTETGLSALAEGITEKTNRQLMTLYFPEFDLEDQAVYEFRVGAINTICRTISEANGNLYPTADHVFELFKKSHFEGRSLALGRAIDATYGHGSYAKLIELFAYMPIPTGKIEDDTKLFQFAPVIYDLLSGRMSFDEYEKQRVA